MRYSEISAGWPKTRPITSPGTPASRKARTSSTQLAGVSSGPFRITEQPAQSAAETLRTAWLIGKFHGVKAATGPTGSRMTICITPSARPGMTRP